MSLGAITEHTAVSWLKRCGVRGASYFRAAVDLHGYGEESTERPVRPTPRLPC